MLEVKGSGWSVLELEIAEFSTIESTLADIARDNIQFRKAVYDPDRGRLNKYISIFLNNSILDSGKIGEIYLTGGDTLLILPMYAGG